MPESRVLGAEDYRLRSRASRRRWNTDVVEILEKVGRVIGLPASIRVDQGTEFASRDPDLWAYRRRVNCNC
jgi:hypothetical protein